MYIEWHYTLEKANFLEKPWQYDIGGQNAILYMIRQSDNMTLSRDQTCHIKAGEQYIPTCIQALGECFAAMIWLWAPIFYCPANMQTNKQWVCKYSIPFPQMHEPGRPNETFCLVAAGFVTGVRIPASISFRSLPLIICSVSQPFTNEDRSGFFAPPDELISMVDYLTRCLNLSVEDGAPGRYPALPFC